MVETFHAPGVAEHKIRHSPGNSPPMPDRFAHYASASALRMHARIPSSRGVT